MKSALQFGIVQLMPVEAEVEVEKNRILSLINILNPAEHNATTWEGKGYDPLHDDAGLSVNDFETELKKEKVLALLLKQGAITRIEQEKPCTIEDEYSQKVVRP